MNCGELQFKNSTYECRENNVWITERPSIERISGTDGAVTVRVQVTTTNKTINKAIKSGDFTLPDQLLMWSDGEGGAKEIDITILEDSLIEPDEIITLSLIKITNASYGFRKKCTIIIKDNDYIPTSPIEKLEFINESNSLPNRLPNSIGEIWISSFTEPNKELIYVGLGDEINKYWRRISDFPIVSNSVPVDSGDFIGQLWVNNLTNNAWIYTDNDWSLITNNICYAYFHFLTQNNIILREGENQLELDVIDSKSCNYENGKIYLSKGKYRINYEITFKSEVYTLESLAIKVSDSNSNVIGRSRLYYYNQTYNNANFDFFIEILNDDYLSIILVNSGEISLPYSNEDPIITMNLTKIDN